MLYRLHHTTTYDYAEPVVLGTHFMHLLPRGRPGQIVREAELAVSPTPDTWHDEADYFGNPTSTVSLTTVHKRFSVTLSASVEVAHPPAPAPEQTPGWETIAAAAIHDFTVAEFCLGSPLARPSADIAAYAATSFPPGRPALAGLVDLTRRLWDDLTYRSGVTSVATTATQVLHARTGVCQDYAHLMIAALRACGLPARYVSGYLRTYPPAGERHRGADQSHAWVSAWTGPDHGWIDFDPTNNLLISDEHVTLAWGRDFQDVSPLRGIILGGGRHSLRVAVDLDPILT